MDPLDLNNRRLGLLSPLSFIATANPEWYPEIGRYWVVEAQSQISNEHGEGPITYVRDSFAWAKKYHRAISKPRAWIARLSGICEVGTRNKHKL